MFVYGQEALALALLLPFVKTSAPFSFGWSVPFPLPSKKIISAKTLLPSAPTFAPAKPRAKLPQIPKSPPKNSIQRSKITFPSFHCSLNLHHDSDGVHVLTVLECTAISDTHPSHNRAREHVAASGAEASSLQMPKGPQKPISKIQAVKLTSLNKLSGEVSSDFPDGVCIDPRNYPGTSPGKLRTGHRRRMSRPQGTVP